jgi:hypothetical protein
MDFSAKVTFPDTLLVQDIDGEILIYNMQDNSYFALKAISREIWEYLYEGRSLEETLDILLEKYDIDREILERDMESFVHSLMDSRLLSLESSEQHS